MKSSGTCLDANSGHIVVPDHLEEVFLVRGPKVFERLVQDCGGKMMAGKVAGVSHSTMSRWINTPLGAIFGPRKDMRCYRSMWFGYPSPFPGLDRIAEEMYGNEKSFLGKSIEIRGLTETMRWMRCRTGFGLEMLPLSFKEITGACRKVGIPAATRRRWCAGVLYPRQWYGLDALAGDVDGVSWLESVLRTSDEGFLPRKVSSEALACMAGDFLLSG